MSRRYGRNQKRRHRKRIAELEQDLSAWRDRELAQRRAREAAERDRAWLVEAVQTVSPFSALLEAKRVHTGLDYLAWPVRKPRSLEPFGIRGKVNPVVFAERQVDLHRLIHEIYQEPGRLETVVRVRLGNSGYQRAFSPGALRQLKNLPHLVNEVAADIARALADHLGGAA